LLHSQQDIPHGPCHSFQHINLRQTQGRRIVVADTLGYCWGVRRAVDIITDASSTESPIAPIGDVIHNPQVVARLRSRGVTGAASIDERLTAG
jgi:4-hydroxy-3-methylbut-2-enyl diphosphate reductase